MEVQLPKSRVDEIEAEMDAAKARQDEAGDTLLGAVRMSGPRKKDVDAYELSLRKAYLDAVAEWGGLRAARDEELERMAAAAPKVSAEEALEEYQQGIRRKDDGYSPQTVARFVVGWALRQRGLAVEGGEAAVAEAVRAGREAAAGRAPR